MSQTKGHTRSQTNGHVLEFQLGAETYCVSIDFVTEIVDETDLTTVPNSPRHVEGVMDLRGRTTSIIDPKAVFGLDDGDGENPRIVVFEPEIVADTAGAGWLVDDVEQVVEVDPADVDEGPASDSEAINGVVKRGEGDFVIWVDPRPIHAET